MITLNQQIRTDLDTNWTSVNPVLDQGEFGYSIDGNLLKIGDGVTHWNDLIAIHDTSVTSYEHTQGAPSNSWSVSHNLGTKKIVLQCYDGSGQPIDENNYSFIDNDNLTINFTSPVSGTATLLSSGGEMIVPAPGGGTDLNFEQTFSNVTGGGTFTHGLGKYPSVTVLDGTGKEVVIEVTHTNNNTINITWIGILSGRVIAN